MNTLYRALAGALGCMFAAIVWAAPPMTLIWPASPGGGGDLYFRIISKVMGAKGVNLVVRNVPGGGATIGVQEVLHSKPDGNTIGGVWTGPISISPHTLGVPYKRDDYIPVLQFSSAPYVLCTRPDFPVDTGAELIELVKKNPNKYTYGTDGPGGLGQLAATRIFMAFGTSERDIPYKGASESSLAMLSGVVDMYSGTIPTILPHVKSGKAKCLLLTSARHNPALPGVSSLADVGIPKEESLLWRAILVPKGTPAADIERVEKLFEDAARSPQALAFLKQVGETLELLKGKELKASWDREYEAYGKIVKLAGMARKQ